MGRIQVINAQDRIKLDDGSIDRLRQFLEKVCEMEGCDDRDEPINVIIVDNDYISKLNRQFLGREGPTDVLSFDLDDVAEIYVSIEYDPQAVHHFALHGLLHIIGYDHKVERDASVMRAREEQYLKLWTSS